MRDSEGNEREREQERKRGKKRNGGLRWSPSLFRMEIYGNIPCLQHVNKRKEGKVGNDEERKHGRAKTESS